MSNTQEFIAHFGVPGMKWGFRRDRGSDGHVIGRAKPTGGRVAEETHVSDDFANAYMARQKAKKAGGLQVLSNEELQALVSRQNLEAQYARLNPRRISAGEKFARGAGDILANSAKNATQQVVSATFKAALEKGVNSGAAAAKERALARNAFGPKNAGKVKRFYYSQKSKKLK